MVLGYPHRRVIGRNDVPGHPRGRSTRSFGATTKSTRWLRQCVVEAAAHWGAGTLPTISCLPGPNGPCGSVSGDGWRTQPAMLPRNDNTPP
jgi:hypothetical protein